MSCSNEEKCFSCTWEIKNFEVLMPFLKKNNTIPSPTFRMNSIPQKDWKLCLKISWCNEELVFQLHGFHKYGIPERYTIFLSSSDGEVFLNERQNDHSKVRTFVIQENAVFGDNKESILPDHTLTVCWKIHDKTLETTGEYRFHSTIHKLNNLWIIQKFDPSKFHTKTFIEKENILFYVSLDPKDHNCISGIIAGGVCIKGDVAFYLVDVKWSIKGYDGNVSSNKQRDPYGAAFKWNIRIDNSYSEKDLQLELESMYIDTYNKPVPKSSTLSNDIWNLYKEQLHTDATLNSADGKSFVAHRSILAARSPVFRAMFERQEMSEGRSGVVDIDDVNSQTMDRMLVFLYSDSLDDLQWEEAAALYYAADKYAIQPLKKKCTDILKAGLTVENVCDALVLSYRHSEKELVRCIVDFICDHQEVVSSAKWKMLEEKNIRLSHEILRCSFLQCKRRK